MYVHYIVPVLACVFLCSHRPLWFQDTFLVTGTFLVGAINMRWKVRVREGLRFFNYPFRYSGWILDIKLTIIPMTVRCCCHWCKDAPTTRIKRTYMGTFIEICIIISRYASISIIPSGNYIMRALIPSISNFFEIPVVLIWTFSTKHTNFGKLMANIHQNQQMTEPENSSNSFSNWVTREIRPRSKTC